MKIRNTSHQIIYKPADQLNMLPAESVDLIVTSPPYPMIEMWDDIFFKQNKDIKKAFSQNDFGEVFELMHKELDKVWEGCFHALKNGGIACINIGDATRTFDKNFQLFPNHSRIIESFLNIGFQNLPNIIWRKQTNAPNKFMGSGMLPPGAYVTLEHEYILIFRKGEKRTFKNEPEKLNRQNSSYFWEERNTWFSDLWDVKGARQNILEKKSRNRSAAYPFEIPYRLINMFSVMGDTVVDPFLGTGTTSLAALAAHRNSIGYEIDPQLEGIISSTFFEKEKSINQMISKRLRQHLLFVENRKKTKGANSFKYNNETYGFPVMTNQEKKTAFPYVEKITVSGDGFSAKYFDEISINSPNELVLF